MISPSQVRVAAAKIARYHKPKVVVASQWKYMDRETREEIHVEQRGERIAAEIIAKAIEAMPLLPADPPQLPDGLMEDMVRVLRMIAYPDGAMLNAASAQRMARAVLDRYHATKETRVMP